MDEKMQAFLNVRVWEELFPKFRQKGISQKVLEVLAAPKYRVGLVKMIENDEYELEPPREVEIPKGDGKYRKIYVCSDLDRCVLAVAAKVYTEKYSGLIHPNCVSYQEGLSVPRILKRIQGSLGAGGYKVDLSKYFDSVNRSRLDELLRMMDSGSPLDRMIRRFYEDDRIVRDGVVVEHYKSLAQGCALGVLLANLCLAELDEELSQMCEVYVRYSDDILMLGERAEEALGVLKSRISEYGLEVNPKKVSKIRPDSVFTFLGGSVSNECIELTDEKLKKWKKEIKRMCKGKPGSRGDQKAAVKRVRNYFFNRKSGYCAAEYLFQLCTDERCIRLLDEYAKDELKAIYTGKHNRVTNLRRTSNQLLKEMGWLSLVEMRNLWCISKKVFEARVACIGKELRKDQCVFSGDVEEELERLWPIAKVYEGSSVLNVQPDHSRIYLNEELQDASEAVYRMECLIASSPWKWGDAFFWQSKKYPELVVFKDWRI